MQYDDAFTLQRVADDHVEIFNYEAGMVPFLQKLIADVSRFCVSVHIEQLLMNGDLSAGNINLEK